MRTGADRVGVSAAWGVLSSVLGSGAFAAWITDASSGSKLPTWPAWTLSALTICTLYGCFAYSLGIWPANGVFRRAGLPAAGTQTVAVPAVTPDIERDRQASSSPEPAPGKIQQEEGHSHPPVEVGNLHGLNGDQIRLLRDSAVVLRDFLTVTREAERTSPLSQREFADVSAKMKSTLDRTVAQFLALKGSVTVLNWPDREWAAKVISIRETAERELTAAARWNRSGPGDQQRPLAQAALTELLGLLEQHSGLFTLSPEF
jgi:hypothetical protein